MDRFLIDVNLPYYFSLWDNEMYVHQKDINDEWTDRQIWDFAKENNMTIITKDADFSNKILLHTPPPKVIHIRLGNIKMKDFFEVMSKVWGDVLNLNKEYKLVQVYKDRLEGIQ